jgi:hypothetical protein
MVTMIEARTFSPSGDSLGNSVCGAWFEIALPVNDALRAARFWAHLAPELLRVREEPTTHMRFNAAGLPLSLNESIALKAPTLCFRCEDKEAVWIALAKHGFAHHEYPGFESAFISLDAPEGTTLLLLDEDYLGELYEVGGTHRTDSDDSACDRADREAFFDQSPVILARHHHKPHRKSA